MSARAILLAALAAILIAAALAATLAAFAALPPETVHHLTIGANR